MYFQVSYWNCGKELKQNTAFHIILSEWKQPFFLHVKSNVRALLTFIR